MQALRVYPRGCGGAKKQIRPRWKREGLSPRVRGSHPQAAIAKLRYGSIPAGAGEPTDSAPVHGSNRVYPRGCGGAHRKPRQGRSLQGLSPRVRGSLIQGRWWIGGSGSIPAGAGEPRLL